MEKGIAVAGNLIVDQIKYIDRYPSPSTLGSITAVTRSLGGLVCNCTVDLAKLDRSIPLKAVGVVGQDDAGDYILQQLAAYPSIDIARVRRGGATSFTDVMTESDGRRTFFQYRGANAQLCPDDFDFSELSADILHIGYILLLDLLDGPDPAYPTAMCRVLDRAQKAGIRTSIDVVSEDSGRFPQIVPPALRYTDYCTINELEAERITGIPLTRGSGALIRENMEKACHRLKEMGVGRWAVVHTPERSCGMDETGRYVEEASWRIPAGFKRSSVGAGDAFASGILYGVYRGWTLEQSIHAAGAIAAHSLSGAGASDAILPIDELLARMERLCVAENRNKHSDAL